MRIFGRFLYALFAVGVFLLAFQYSIMTMREMYYEDVFGGSLTDETSDLPDFYYFYATLPDYHKSDPIIELDQDGYQIRGYEIARTTIEDNELDVEETIFFIVYHDNPDELMKVDRILINNDDPRNQIEVHLGRYRDLDILVSMDPLTSYYLFSKDDIDFSLNYTDMSLVDENNGTLSESVFILEEDDFTINENLQAYFNTHQALPTADTIDELSDPDIEIRDEDITNNNYVVDEYIYVMGIIMGIYFVVLIVSTYLIFFKKWKKKQPF